MTNPAGVIDPPALDGFTTFYGVQVSTFGEDGDLVALGHHDKRIVLAAFLAYYRKVIGDPLGLYVADPTDPTELISPVWGELLGPCGECPDSVLLGVCDQCAHADRGEWFMKWHDEPQPGTFPITLLDM